MTPFTLRRVAAAIPVATLALLLSGTAAVAAPDPPTGGGGPLTLTPTTGNNFTALTARSSGPCPTTSQAYNVVFFHTPPDGSPSPFNRESAGNANGFPAVTTTTAGFSTTGPISAPFRNTFQDFAQEVGENSVPLGEYRVRLQCLDNDFDQNVVRTFTGALNFTSSTSYRVQAPAQPNPVIPEVPLAVLIPIAAIALIGGATVVARRRSGVTAV